MNADAPTRRPGPPVIPDFELIRPIGQGAYGEVWLARGLTGVYRAIKVVWRDRFADAGPFEREFSGLKRFTAMSRPEAGQLALLHVGQNEQAGFFYYVMELADDVDTGDQVNPAKYRPLTLRELRARRGRLPAAECVTFGVELAWALAGLHAHGLVHRDIKPSNVILVGGVPKLADIGLVASTADAMSNVGTEGFLPPEGPGQPSADVFALGRLLYELATGLDRQEFPRLPPEMGQRPDRKLLLELNEIILRAGEPIPEQRYHDASAMLDDLLVLQAGGSLRHRWASPLVGRVCVALAFVAMAAAAAWMWLRPSAATTAPAPWPESAASTKPPIVDATAREKSLVVLPLENLSPDPENAFFTDGIHAEIIATLGRIPDLRVISRNSARSYRDSKASLTEIGRQLGVAYVITGSVRRAEKRVRIQLDLRRASDEELLWAQTYDRELSDVFAIQGDIADEVARVLQARAAGGLLAGAQFMTKDPRAYDLYLKSISITNYGFGADPVRDRLESIKLLEEAMQLDPNFMSAADALSTTHTDLVGLLTDPEDRLRHAAEAKRWAEKASQLMPGGAGDGSLAFYYITVEGNTSRGLDLAEKYLQARPNEDNAHIIIGLAKAYRGRMDEAEKEQRQAIALDPRNLEERQLDLLYLADLRRYNAWNAALSEIRAMLSAAQGNDASFVYARYQLTGELPATLDDIHGLDASDRVFWLWHARRFAEALDLINAELALPQLNDDERFRFRIWQSDVLRRLDRAKEVDEAARVALALAEKLRGGVEVDRSVQDYRLAAALARIGRFEEAIAAARRYVEAMRVPDRQWARWHREISLAKLYAHGNRPTECIALLARLLRVPSGLTVPMLRVDPAWDNVRSDPRFEALLNDPKNNAPLF